MGELSSSHCAGIIPSYLTFMAAIHGTDYRRSPIGSAELCQALHEPCGLRRNHADHTFIVRHIFMAVPLKLDRRPRLRVDVARHIAFKLNHIIRGPRCFSASQSTDQFDGLSLFGSKPLLPKRYQSAFRRWPRHPICAKNW